MQSLNYQQECEGRRAQYQIKQRTNNETLLPTARRCHVTAGVAKQANTSSVLQKWVRWGQATAWPRHWPHIRTCPLWVLAADVWLVWHAATSTILAGGKCNEYWLPVLTHSPMVFMRYTVQINEGLQGLLMTWINWNRSTYTGGFAWMYILFWIKQLVDKRGEYWLSVSTVVCELFDPKLMKPSGPCDVDLSDL